MNEVSEPLLLHVGFDNVVMVSQILGVFDIRSAAIKRIIDTAKEERPRSVISVTKGRKAWSVIFLSGDRYVVSCIPRKQIYKRLLGDGFKSPTE